MKQKEKVVPLSGQTVFFKPKNPLLTSCISYYYFVFSDDASFHSEYNFYPHFKSTVSVYQHSDVQWTADTSTTRGNPKAGINAFYSRIYKTPMHVSLHGCFQKLGIVLHPLGLNHFVETDLAVLAPDEINPFPHLGTDFNAVCTELFEHRDIEIATLQLDAFFASKFKDLADDRVARSMERIMNLDDDVSATNLARSLDINRKTLYALFKKQLGCSFNDFRKVVHFRASLEKYMADHNITLTQLAHDNHFYDQSHFNRLLSQLTGSSPKSFFRSLKRVGQEDVYWRFDEG